MDKKFKKPKTTALTLIELMAVIIIIAILAAFAWPRFLKTRELMMDEEAKSILKLIQAAEKAYFLTEGNKIDYFPKSGVVSDLSAVNSNLSINLVDKGNWIYNISGTPGKGFVAMLTRPQGWLYAQRYWLINSTTTEPICDGGCLQ